MKEICIHGHFYQPTRENPWTGVVEEQPSAAPFPNWNERISAECYAPNMAAQLCDDVITRAVRNNYASLTFDFGPTLLGWLEEQRPVLLEGIRRADRDSVVAFGAGSAMAQPYHHPILPLCDEDDRRTEISWGLACFRRIFERPAEGMWLSECAVDTPTLEALAAQGLSFVILAPHQLDAVRDPETGGWRELSESVCANRAFRLLLPSGREIAAVAYDGLTSRAIAFEGLLHNGDDLADRLVEAASATGLVLASTDGESYGHHHARGEMALAYALEQLESRPDVRVTNVASWLARNPPQQEARIREGSSWSCSHGLGRWMEDCGCRSQPEKGWHQQWRGPLRAALESLRDQARSALDDLGARLFRSPLEARDAYGETLRQKDQFLDWYQAWAGEQRDPTQALEWLEIHRHLLASFTSCGWFFDELSGLEPLQNIRHAACAITKLRRLTEVDLAPLFRDSLLKIPCNLGTDAVMQAFELASQLEEPKTTVGPSISEDSRRAGVLNPVSALGGAGPIGDLDGSVAFIDWLAEAGVSLWQVLPLVPPDGTGSPYSSWSALSGNPELVGLEDCIRHGLLPPSARLPALDRVDYDEVRRLKRPLVLQAAAALLAQPEHRWSADLRRFEERAEWATDAALFYAISEAHDGAPWWTWPEPLRSCDLATLERARAAHSEQIALWRTALFLFERQWAEVRSYAASRGVQLVGDMPIYVGRDSVDVWLNQHLFLLDEAGFPTKVAGVPPDVYAEDGQLWGNPLYDWEAIAEDGYSWWIARMQRALEHCDALRIDHFIGFSRYWAVDANAETARGGAWCKGPGSALFDALAHRLGPLPLIAEDLGEVDQGTIDLRDGLGLPGMRISIFGYDENPDNMHHPANHPVCCVTYSSTHDSDTARGWWDALSEEERNRLGLGLDGYAAGRQLVDQTLGSAAAWAIIPLQDMLELGSEARINVPGTVLGNWTWRQPSRHLDVDLARHLRDRIECAGRLAVQAHR